MNACCRSAAAPGLGKRGLRALPWLLPSVLLALLPKCPACFAAWLALAGGIGVSASAASHLRDALVVLCVGSALYAVTRLLRRRLVSRVRDPSGSSPTSAG